MCFLSIFQYAYQVSIPFPRDSEDILLDSRLNLDKDSMLAQLRHHAGFLYAECGLDEQVRTIRGTWRKTWAARCVWSVISKAKAGASNTWLMSVLRLKRDMWSKSPAA